MTLVATLIADDAGARLGEAAATLAKRLGAETVWLAPGRAVDLVFEAPLAEADAVRAEVTARLAGRAIDHAVQPVHGRRKRLLVADMDSTVIATESIDALAARTGAGESVGRITRCSISGECDFGETLAERLALLAGTPEALLETVWRQDVAVTTGAAVTVATMRRHGALTVLVSGGFDWFAGRVASLLGFDRYRANRLDIEAGRLTGRLAGPLLDGAAKRSILAGLTREAGLAASESMAVGDGANDCAMLRAAGFGVGWRPVPAAEEAADATIRHNGLEALLYMQGYAAGALQPPYSSS